MKKDNLKSIIVLTAICLVVSALLAAINYVTKPIIEKNAFLKENASLAEVLPGAKDFEEADMPSDAAECVTGIYKESGGAGYAVTISTTSAYSGAPMTFTLGVGTDGKVTGIVMTNYSETKDFGAEYPESYIGVDADSAEDVDLVSGVTYSSTAFRNAVKGALDAVKLAEEAGK